MEYPSKLLADCEYALMELQELIFDVRDALKRSGVSCLPVVRSELKHLDLLLSSRLREQKRALDAVKSESGSTSPCEDNWFMLHHLRHWICSSANEIPVYIKEVLRDGQEGTS